MTVSKAVVRGILLACLAATTARGGSILYLGVTSGDWLDTSVAASPSLLSPSSLSSPTPMPMPMPSAPPLPAPPASGSYDGFINLGSGPYVDSALLTTGNAQPWYLGASVDRLFGGLPTIPQLASFDEAVLARIGQTFALGGIAVAVTNNPNVPAAHTISVVSGTNNPTIPGALGMTYVGGNGFQYMDVAAASAGSVDQLEWIVAHNLAHELMLAFHVPEVHDQSGRFIDSPTANWSSITNPFTTFSPGAIADLMANDFQASGGVALNPSAQRLGPPTVPEPSTAILWAAIASVGIAAGRLGVLKTKP